MPVGRADRGEERILVGKAMRVARADRREGVRGIADLQAATHFYEAVLEALPNQSYESVTFFQLSGTWLALYPIEKLAEDISPDVPTAGRGFSGMTLAHNVRSRNEVLAIVNRARSAGARVRQKRQRKLSYRPRANTPTAFSDRPFLPLRDAISLLMASRAL